MFACKRLPKVTRKQRHSSARGSSCFPATSPVAISQSHDLGWVLLPVEAQPCSGVPLQVPYDPLRFVTSPCFNFAIPLDKTLAA